MGREVLWKGGTVYCKLTTENSNQLSANSYQRSAFSDQPSILKADIYRFTNPLPLL